jgi:nucleoside-diphosphate-sugar epimerase
VRIFIIGGTGFIGRQVIERLRASEHEIAVLHRGVTHATLSEGVTSVRGDRERLEDSRSAIQRFAPDVVLDVIPYTERQARALVETVRGFTGRVVALSSADVYRNYDGLRGRATAPPDPVPLTEESPLRATRYPYRGQALAFEHADDYEKILVEEALLAAGDVPPTILRLPAVYGPGDAQHRLRPYLQRMVDQRPAILLEERMARWRWTRGHVDNVAAAIVLAITDSRGTGQIYNVGDEPTLTERDWVMQIGAAFGWRGEVLSVPALLLPESLRNPFDTRYDLWIDTSRIRERLGYAEPVMLQEGLRRTIEWELSSLPTGDGSGYRDEDLALARHRGGGGAGDSGWAQR